MGPPLAPVLWGRAPQAGAVGADSVGESRGLEEGGRPDSGSVVLSIADAVSFGTGEVAWGNSLALSGFLRLCFRRIGQNVGRRGKAVIVAIGRYVQPLGWRIGQAGISF